jgi:hypothetical protein
MVRDCYTCAHSPRWFGVGTVAGCDALTGYERRDRKVVDFCEASGVNDEDSDRRGWPREGNDLDCGKWKGRDEVAGE